MSSSSASQVLPEKQNQQVERILKARNDEYGGVMVEMTNEPMEAGVFLCLLRASLSHWRQQWEFKIFGAEDLQKLPTFHPVKPWYCFELGLISGMRQKGVKSIFLGLLVYVLVISAAADVKHLNI
ncbi:unnamed protein product [Fraxinus pennsylvanica]|uniref:Pre-nudix hydrolase domain-containing protein n=1 Tax=Fraxinus pennsylvanica TaxID=56036 RepID=A0AAD2E9N8_9LAMI|nr:unnamed protein product [Fraxinus pennsylvanica]